MEHIDKQCKNHQFWDERLEFWGNLICFTLEIQGNKDGTEGNLGLPSQDGGSFYVDFMLICFTFPSKKKWNSGQFQDSGSVFTDYESATSQQPFYTSIGSYQPPLVSENQKLKLLHKNNN